MEQYSFTRMLDRTRETLFETFVIYTRPQAQRVLRKMDAHIRADDPEGLMDLNRAVLRMLRTVPAFESKYGAGQPENADAPAEKVIRHGIFDDPAALAAAMEEYRRYAAMLPTAEEADRRFLHAMYDIYKEYRSSSDYMTRLVQKRLAHLGAPFSLDAPTRVLILRQFIREFGYCEGDADLADPVLKAEIAARWGGDYTAADDSLFRLVQRDPAGLKEKQTLRAMLLHRAGFLRIDADIAALVCAVFGDTRPELLSPQALNGTAGTLAECFAPAADLKSLAPEDLSAKHTPALCAALKGVYTASKKQATPALLGYDTRLFVLTDRFGGAITVDEAAFSALRAALPRALFLTDAGEGLPKPLAEIIDLKKLGNPRYLEDLKRCDPAKEAAISLLEAQLPAGANETEKPYTELLLERIQKRFNDACKAKTLPREWQSAPACPMLQAADDLANARFFSRRNLREKLYVFAIAFGMKYNAEDAADPFYADIRTNLFYDYFADNVVNGGSDGNILSGTGVNYKNYAEVIYLYCIRKYGDAAAPREVLARAKEMIARCERAGKTGEKDPHADRYTEVYKEGFLNAPDDDDAFVRFVCENYVCSPAQGAINAAKEARTAAKLCGALYTQLKKLIEKIPRRAGLFDSVDTPAELAAFEESAEYRVLFDYYRKREYYVGGRCKNCPHRQYVQNGEVRQKSRRVFDGCELYGSSFQTADAAGKTMPDGCSAYFRQYSKDRILTAEDREKYRALVMESVRREPEKYIASFWNISSFQWQSAGDPAFEAVLEAVQYRLRRVAGDLARTNAPQTAGRTELIALYYYYIVLYNLERTNRDLPPFRDLRSFYEHFCRQAGCKLGGRVYHGVNELLETAGYQEIHSKNLFDMFVIFIAFKDNYMRLYRPELEDAEALMRKEREGSDAV